MCCKVWRSSAYVESYVDEKERKRKAGREREGDRFSRERESRLEQNKEDVLAGTEEEEATASR